MKSRKYQSFNEAITDLTSKGTLKYWGRIGDNFEICLYTFVFNGEKFTLYIYDDGRVEIR